MRGRSSKPTSAGQLKNWERVGENVDNFNKVDAPRSQSRSYLHKTFYNNELRVFVEKPPDEDIIQLGEPDEKWREHCRACF